MSTVQQERALELLLAVEEVSCYVLTEEPEEPEVGCSRGGGCSDETCGEVHDYEESPGDAFLGAAVDNDVLSIRRLIEENVSPSHSNPAKQSALHLAALWGNVEAVQELLKYKASVNAQNTLSGATPLHAIVMNGYAALPRLLECADALLAHGADPTIQDQRGKTPADYYSGKIQERALLARLQPQPALFQAIDQADVSAVKTILESPEYTNRAKETLFAGKVPFEYALDMVLEETKEPKEPKILAALMEMLAAMAKELEDNSNDSFLAELCVGGESAQPPLFRVCAVLQDACTNSRSEDPEKSTIDKPKMEALGTIFRLLAPFWPITDPKLIEQFHAACRKNAVDMAVLFLEVCKMDPNAKGKMGMTALHFAARSGSANMAEYLLSRKQIDPTIVDDQGKTPHDAATLNKKENVVVLLQEFFSRRRRLILLARLVNAEPEVEINGFFRWDAKVLFALLG